MDPNTIMAIIQGMQAFGARNKAIMNSAMSTKTAGERIFR